MAYGSRTCIITAMSKALAATSPCTAMTQSPGLMSTVVAGHIWRLQANLAGLSRYQRYTAAPVSPSPADRFGSAWVVERTCRSCSRRLTVADTSPFHGLRVLPIAVGNAPAAGWAGPAVVWVRSCHSSMSLMAPAHLASGVGNSATGRSASSGWSVTGWYRLARFSSEICIAPGSLNGFTMSFGIVRAVPWGLVMVGANVLYAVAAVSVSIPSLKLFVWPVVMSSASSFSRYLSDSPAVFILASICPPLMSMAAVSFAMLILPAYFFIGPGSTHRALIDWSGYSTPGPTSGAGLNGPMMSMYRSPPCQKTGGGPTGYMSAMSNGAAW